MAFEDVYLVTEKLETVAEDAIIALEHHLGIALPSGYRPFMTTLGKGTFCDLVSVYSPEQILQRQADARERWHMYYDAFWDDPDRVLSKEQVMESILFAHTADSDEFIVCPSLPNRTFILPRHDNTVYWTDDSFIGHHTWFGPHGSVEHLSSFKYFESNRDRQRLSLFTAQHHLLLTDIATFLTAYWPYSPQHRRGDPLAEDTQWLILFIAPIGGRIQLTQGLPRDGRIGITMTYDSDSGTEVRACVNQLLARGFYQVSPVT